MVIHTNNEEDDGAKNAIETVENTLVSVLGVEESRGRFLYDMARSFNNMKYHGAVYQRNPLNSCERIWMTVVEIPSAFLQGNPSMSPFSSADFQENMHRAKCTLIICRGNDLLRCQPYVLVLGKQVKLVDRAVVATKQAMKQYMQTLAGKSLPSNSNAKSPEIPRSWAPKSKSNPRKLIIPGWLLSDDLFLQQIKGVYCFIHFTFSFHDCY